MLLPVNVGRLLAHSNASRPASLAAVRRSAVCSDAEATPPRGLKETDIVPIRTGPYGSRATPVRVPKSSAWARPPRQGRHPWDRVPSATEDDAVQALDDQRTHGRSVSPPPRPGRSPGHLGQGRSVEISASTQSCDHLRNHARTSNAARVVTPDCGSHELPSTTALRAPALYSKQKRFLRAYGTEQVTVQRIAHQTKAFGHAVMEGTMALSEGGNGPAECGAGIVVLIIVTL